MSFITLPTIEVSDPPPLNVPSMIFVVTPEVATAGPRYCPMNLVYVAGDQPQVG